MSLSLRIRLSMMMFLQYAIWGAWAPVLYTYLRGPLGFTEGQSSWIFSALWLASIVAPFLGGQIVDRWLPTQYFLAGAQFVGGILLLLTVKQTGFPRMMLFMSLYCLLYAPTLALTNSLAFHHLDDADKQFGGIRVWGTIGWIAIGWILSGWRSGYLLLKAADKQGDCLILAAVASLVMGVFCLFLPHTPPKKETESPWAFLEALRLLKIRDFAVFMAICFVVTTELQFYYMPTPQFLQDLGVSPAAVPATMTIAQIAELFTMALLLPLLLPRLGVRRCLAIGVIAWPIRYILFAIGKPLWLVKASLALHGLGFTFFFVVSQIYVDRVAPKDIRASVQSLLTLITIGFGNFFGTKFTGLILGAFKKGDQTQWTRVFIVPCLLTFACAVAFLIWFRDAGENVPAEEGAGPEAEGASPSEELARAEEAASEAEAPPADVEP
ncbi:MAG: nucleoside permease [Planctomycetes bacterium]|nr:nucleoside permease [Planctomycetota bacterium]